MLKLAKIVIKSLQGFFREEIEMSRSEMGYRVQEDQVERLLNRFAGFTTVEITDVYGRPITLPLRRGADGGIDVIFTISAPTEHGASIVYGRVRNILLNNDY
ncbi:MAG: hypothetical protein MZV65_08375 [Chromatiales bacterium]|nr:hypothetical protein [Chromatiales bacterium]